MALKALLQSLGIQNGQLLIELLVIGRVGIDCTLEGHLGLNLRINIANGPILKDESPIVIAHGLGLSIQLVCLALEDLGSGDSSLLGILFQLLLLSLEFEQILAVVENGFQELVAEVAVHKIFEAIRQLFAILSRVVVVLVIIEYVLHLVLDVVVRYVLRLLVETFRSTSKRKYE